MFVKLLIVTTILCMLQCSEVNSFEVITNAFKSVKNKIKNVAHKVHDFFDPNHKHSEECKHLHHDHDHEYDTDDVTTTLKPLIDVRYGPPEQKIPNGEQQPSGQENPVSTTPNDIPDLQSRSIIGAPCGNGMRYVNGDCRQIIA